MTRLNPVSLSLVVLLLIPVVGVGCGVSDEAPRVDQRVASSALEDGRYIVAFANPRGEAAARASGAVEVELPQLDALALTLPAQAAQALAANPNIAYIEPDAPRALLDQVRPYGVDMVLAPVDPPLETPLLPGGPDRITVCIIDSGFGANHEDFGGLPVDGASDPGTGDWFVDRDGHGTHVAGTIAAADNTLGVVGVGPDAISLYIVKVFGDDGAWAYSSSLVAAAYQCQDAGARVISMSLGGSFKSRTEDRAFNSLYNDGLLLVAAAGNDGSNARSYPASYNSVISVAAVDAARNVADFSQHNAQVELAAPGVDVLSTVPYLNTARVVLADATVIAGHPLENAAHGSATALLVASGLCDAPDAALSGAIALCERGAVSFFDKVANAQDSGALGVIISNNVPGDFIGTLGDGVSSAIPAISVSQEAGLLLAGQLGAVVTLDSLFDPDGSGYEAWSGTSMATPHVSAVAALVWSHNHGWTNKALREALQTTAEDLGASGRDDYTGYGLVQGEAALAFLSGGVACEPSAPSEVACADGQDDDCDGLIDAEDPDCAGACFAPGALCVSDGDCCSLRCKGKAGASTCR